MILCKYSDGIQNFLMDRRLDLIVDRSNLPTPDMITPPWYDQSTKASRKFKIASLSVRKVCSCSPSTLVVPFCPLNRGQEAKVSTCLSREKVLSLPVLLRGILRNSRKTFKRRKRLLLKNFSFPNARENTQTAFCFFCATTGAKLSMALIFTGR